MRQMKTQYMTDIIDFSITPTYESSFYCLPWLRFIVRGDNDSRVKEACLIYKCKISIPGNNRVFGSFVIESLSKHNSEDCKNHLINYLDDFNLEWSFWRDDC